MYKIKLFSAAKSEILEQEINQWLQLHKDILIHSSNLTENTSATLGIREYNFHILFTGPDQQDEELKEMAAIVTQDQSVEVKEMNPEILKPSS
ncbi:MAG: hypothetical protein ABIQ88_19430 [Chitinophagaceae bacterium]